MSTGHVRRCAARRLLSSFSTGLTLVAGVVFVAACADDNEPRSASVSPAMSPDEVAALHDRLLTIDTHDDIPFDFATDTVDAYDGDRQVSITKMEDGGLDVGFFIVYVGQTERTPENMERARERAIQKFEAIHRMTSRYPDFIELAYTADDVERIVADGKLCAAIGIENGFVIGRDLGLLRTYHDMGARYITLAHGGHNDIADSATPRESLGDDPEGEHRGISAFGETVIAEMNRIGIMVDVSHISKAAMMDAVRLSRAPVIASHSSTRALADHPRNLDDEQLRALAENGGVVQIVALGDYVKVQPPEGGSPATVADFVDHIDHAVDVAGLEHVGISSDFDGGGGVVGWNDASETLNVTAELVLRGYTEAEIAQLWGGNTLRVWREAERVAAELHAGG
ncbi:MAG: dipeptidase [Gemmatimonadetes bacterium]|nr:dipeptidase [Gemmatimonadota bacterium]